MALPAPFQPANGCFVELELLPDPNPFHPEYSASFPGSNNEPVPLLTRNLMVRKQILELYFFWHSNGLKAISRTPVSQTNGIANLLRIKVFAP